MKENQGSNELLLLFDGIGLLITTVALMLVYSKLAGTLDTNLLIASLFFFGIKLLIVGIADVVGFGKKIVFGILFIIAADGILLAVNLLMAFGISNKLLLISAGADLLVILLIRFIWNSRFKASSEPKKAVADNSTDLSGITFEENAFDAFRYGDTLANQPTDAELSDLSGEARGLLDTMPTGELNEGRLPEDSSEPVVSVEMEQLVDLPQVEELLFEDELITETDPEIKSEERTMLQPLDLPNLTALDDFFDEPAEVEPVEEPQLQIESEPEEEPSSQIESEPVDDMSSLNQRLSEQIQELHSRLDDLEAREAKLKKREQEMEEIWKKKIELRPKEVILDDEDSEIIINEDDLELLKAYIRRGNKL